MELPSGTVTFVFTDIEGSTKLFHELGDEGFLVMLEDHNRLIRQALADHGGVEVKTEGDAFLAAFADPAAAVASCLDAQVALDAHDWAHGEPVKVRIGLHVGHAHVVDDDYVGLAVHEAARIASAANGGQVLVSQAIAEAVGDRLPADAGLRDVGRHALKDFPEPVTLYQLTHPGLRPDVPPPRTLTARDHNLPVPPTPMTGRAEDLADVIALLVGDSRLVTITGTGGLGKSRLAIEAGWNLLSWFRDGVWFVGLTEVIDPDLIPEAMASTLGVTVRPDQEPLAAVVDHLASTTTLLVLDNFEQVLDGATVVSELLARCPEVRVLATSRERLRLRGEHLVSLSPLSLPAGTADPAAVAASEAGSLLVQRLSVLDRRFSLDELTAPQVDTICRRLDGLPLALELAAARTVMDGLEAVAVGLDQAMDLLIEGDRDLPRHQQTMRTAIAWTDDLLDPADRLVLRVAGGFRGGFTTEALAAVVTAAHPDDQIDTVPALGRLVDASLVLPAAINDGEPRWWMLEPIRQFAEERLGDDEAAMASTRAQHGVWFRHLAERRGPELTGAGQVAAVAALTADHDNLQHAIRVGDPADAVRTGAALIRYWAHTGRWHEGRRVLGELIDTGVGNAATRAALHLGAGNLAVQQQDLATARALLEQAVTFADDAGDHATVALAANLLGKLSNVAGDAVAATTWWDRAREAATAAEDDRTMSLIHQELGIAATNAGDLDSAATEFRAALEIQRERGDLSAAAVTMTNLGTIATRQRDHATARSWHTQALDSARQTGNRKAELMALLNLASVAAAEGDAAAVLGCADPAVTLADELGEHLMHAQALEFRGWAHIHVGDDTDHRDLKDARHRYQALGAEGMAARVAQLLETAPADPAS